MQAVGDFFNEGLYEEQARLRGIPLLDSRPKQVMRNMNAKDACKNQKVLLHLSIYKHTVEITMLSLLLPLLMRPIFCRLFKVVCLPRVSRVVDIVSVLRTNKHNGFPVSSLHSC